MDFFWTIVLLYGAFFAIAIFVIIMIGWTDDE